MLSLQESSHRASHLTGDNHGTFLPVPLATGALCSWFSSGRYAES